MTELDNNPHLHLSHLPLPRQRYQHDAAVTTRSFLLGGGELGQKTHSSVPLSSQQALVVTKEPIDAHKECAASREQISSARQSLSSRESTNATMISPLAADAVTAASNRIMGATPLLLNNPKPSQYGDDRKSYRQTRNKQNHLPSHRTSFHSGTRRHFFLPLAQTGRSAFRPLLFEPRGLGFGRPGEARRWGRTPPSPTCGESLK